LVRGVGATSIPAKVRTNRDRFSTSFGPLPAIRPRCFGQVASAPSCPCRKFSHWRCARPIHIKTNVEKHIDSKFVFTADVQTFYPSVGHKRGLSLVRTRLRCFPPMLPAFARNSAPHEHHLALGLITSPILADQVMRPIDARIDGLCQDAGLVYTRYVDDLTIFGAV